MTITDDKTPLNVLVTGGSGMLGRAIVKTLSPLFHVTALGRHQFDISDPTQYDHIQSISPDVVINCAAYTQVDLAEAETNPADLANAVGPKHLAEWCATTNARLIHFSTDYVFPGTGTTPWRENDSTQPINRYGLSKLNGEQAIQNSGCDYLILRIQWLYGTGGTNFVDTMTHLLKTRDRVSVVSDQIGSLTWTNDVASQVAQLIVKAPESGIYHLAPAGFGSWYDVVCEINDHLKINTSVIPVTSEAFPRPANRPLNSRLDTTKIAQLNLTPIGKWELRLRRYLESVVDCAPSKISGDGLRPNR